MFNSIDKPKGELIRGVARLCSAAAVVAPKSARPLLLRGKVDVKLD